MSSSLGGMGEMEKVEFSARPVVGHSGQQGRLAWFGLMTSLGRKGRGHLRTEDDRFAVLPANRVAFTINAH